MPDHIEVWCIPLWRALVELSDRLPLLSPEERARAARFATDRDRADFVTVRSTLRSLIGRRLHRSAHDVTLACSRNGKPVLATEGQLRFNVSHTASVALIALADEREVGVDVEAWRGLPPHLEDKVLSAEERDRVHNAPDPVASFYDHWTLKEAFLKASGAGLAVQPRDVMVVPYFRQRLGAFVVQTVHLRSGVSAALAVECEASEHPPSIGIRHMTAGAAKHIDSIGR